MRDGTAREILSYGFVRSDDGAPVEPGTVFRAESITKSVTARGILHLVEAGRLALDDPLQQHGTRWEIPPTGIPVEAITARRSRT